MIIGDVMLDIYICGEVDRISPEAPVPIVAVKKRFSCLGGAANVAQNIKALGAEPVLCSIISNDAKSKEFLDILRKQDMSSEGIIQSDDRMITSKFRIIGNKSHLLRIDEEDTFDLTDKEYELLTQKIDDILERERIDGIILQDYNKGVLTENLIKRVIETANKKNIPIGVDPKKKNFLTYKNVTLFKPNLKELCEGINITLNMDNIDSILQGINILQDKLQSRYVMTTLSEKGILIQEANTVRTHHYLPAHLRKIADVSGAGDTVLSVAMLCLVCKQDAYNIAALSNLAGGLVCEEIGAVPVNKEKLLNEAEKLYRNNE